MDYIFGMQNFEQVDYLNSDLNCLEFCEKGELFSLMARFNDAIV
jgi:hypothetical protein